MRLREILRNISRIPEVHLKLGSHYLVVLNEGKRLRCLLFDWSSYRYGGEPVKEFTKRFEEFPSYLKDLKRELEATKTTVVRVWWM